MLKRNPIHKMLVLLLTLAVFLVISAFTPAYPSPSQASETAGVELNSFYVYNWSWINSPYSCRDPSTGCWVYINYRSAGWAVSQKSVKIDPSWKNPTLVFWTKYYSARTYNFAYVEVQVEGDRRWDRLKVFGNTKDWWHKEQVDLKAYSGKTIIVKFYAQPNFYSIYRNERSNTAHTANKQLFYVQGASIIPDGTVQE